MKTRLPSIAAIVLLIGTLVPVALALAGSQKVEICHMDGSENGTLYVSINAIDGGHFDSVEQYEASGPDNRIGNHGGDYKGQCVSATEPTATVAPLPTDVPGTEVPDPTVPVPLPTDVPGTEEPEPTVPLPPPTEAPPQ